MLIKVSEASGAALDWMVAKCEGLKADIWHTKALTTTDSKTHRIITFNPSTNWAQGGPIIERENIFIMKNSKNEWVSIIHKGSPIGITGLTPLTAAMRCYVASKLGDEVEVPDELA